MAADEFYKLGRGKMIKVSTITSPYAYLRVTPRRIQAWREENELAEREIMRDGHWLG